MVRQHGPGLDDPVPGLGEGRYAGDEVGPVAVVAEEGRPLVPPPLHVVEGPRCIEARLARHSDGRLPQLVLLGDVFYGRV
jgi:hypothetical protein